MSYAPIAADIIVRVTREQAGSARPHAPVIPFVEVGPRRRRRAYVASGLRRLADALEPAGRPIAPSQVR